LKDIECEEYECEGDIKIICKEGWVKGYGLGMRVIERGIYDIVKMSCY